MFCTKSIQFFVHFDGKLFTVHFAQKTMICFVQNHDATSPPLRPPQWTSMRPHLALSYIPYTSLYVALTCDKRYIPYTSSYIRTYIPYTSSARALTHAPISGKKKRSVDLKGHTLLRIYHRIIHTHTPLLPHNRKAYSP